MSTSILIAGVGGQGTLLAARIIGDAALLEGYSAKISEVHGMSQRGGSVITYVRFGAEPIASPLIDLGGADMIMAFEQLETYRSLSYLKPGGLVLTAADRIDPMPVISGAEKYPEGIIDKIKALGIEVITMDAGNVAREAGSEKAANVVMIGLLASRLGLKKETWTETIRNLVPQKLLDVNLRAFEAGYVY